MYVLGRFLLASVLVLIFISPAVRVSTAQSNSARALAGLWEAKHRFGPDIRGTLLIKQRNSGWWAEIAGKIAQAKLDGDAITFELSDGKNAFQGKFEARRTKIVGHWIQPRTLEGGTPYASPVTLTKYGRDVWRGNVSPLDSTMTLYLMVKARNDNSVGAFLKNPERNIGVNQYRVDHIELEGESVKLVAANAGTEKGRVLAEGSYDAERETMSIYFPYRGGTFDFRRVAANETSDFYPHGRPTGTYRYAPPTAFDDGWQTASLEDVGISRAGVEKFIQMIIDTPIDSIHAHEIHGVLIARHGKLVLEEYFHGENRDKPHDTRSAAKSLTATLVGAAIHAGVPLEVSSPVYRVMNGGTFPPNLEPRKKALTVEHLLTMSSGLDCDDNDDNSPGRENFMTDESEEPDYYKFMMNLKMIREPGERAVYCSGIANLLGGVLKRASGKPLPVLFHELIAEPLEIKRYYLNLTPTGDAFMGGGVRLLLRDFMKLGQLHVNGGTWNNRRILTEEWVRRATSPLYEVKDYKPLKPYTFLKYGYLWWVIEYPYKGRTVRAFYAGGNGGQTVMGIPELDLVIAIYAGNYADSPSGQITQGYVPKYILPAVKEGR
ncbi:MAG: serine hydrolase [Pyrinomonadaceae bacterium]|nr:serine hydrolase [Pyrinomonadaceae bacterium]